MTTALYFLRAKQLGFSYSELDSLEVGFVFDLIIESNNDKCEYKTLATQADFDAF